MVSFNDTEEQFFQQTVEWLSSNLNSTPEFIEKETISPICYDGIQIKFKEHEIYVDNQEIPLNHLEFDVLYYLASHPNQVLSKEQIYDAVWNQDKDSCLHSVTCVIYQLRKKIGKQYIQTAIGVGYRFTTK